MGSTEREARIRQAEQRFEEELERAGESMCIASLPLLVDELVTEAAGRDEGLALEIEGRLRRRAGLETSSFTGKPEQPAGIASEAGRVVR
jgi:hypothetical protein